MAVTKLGIDLSAQREIIEAFGVSNQFHAQLSGGIWIILRDMLAKLRQLNEQSRCE